MSTAKTSMLDTGMDFESCLEQLSRSLAPLDGYPPRLLAVALRAHLLWLLQELLQQRICTAVEVRQFLRELQREALAVVPAE